MSKKKIYKNKESWHAIQVNTIKKELSFIIEVARLTSLVNLPPITPKLLLRDRKNIWKKT